MASVVGGQPAAHRLPLGQNSLQGALFTHQPLASGTESATASGSRASAVPAPTIDLEGAPGSGKSYLDEEMQRQLHDYNRSVTIIIWHTVCILSALLGGSESTIVDGDGPLNLTQYFTGREGANTSSTYELDIPLFPTVATFLGHCGPWIDPNIVFGRLRPPVGNMGTTHYCYCAHRGDPAKIAIQDA